MSFILTRLTGFGARGSAVAANPTITYVSNGNKTGAGAISHTFSAQSIGTAWGSYSTGFTENSDQFVGSSNAAAAASGTFVSAETPHAASGTCGTGSRGVAVGASWGN